MADGAPRRIVHNEAGSPVLCFDCRGCGHTVGRVEQGNTGTGEALEHQERRPYSALERALPSPEPSHRGLSVMMFRGP